MTQARGKLRLRNLNDKYWKWIESEYVKMTLLCLSFSLTPLDSLRDYFQFFSRLFRPISVYLRDFSNNSPLGSWNHVQSNTKQKPLVKAFIWTKTRWVNSRFMCDLVDVCGLYSGMSGLCNLFGWKFVWLLNTYCCSCESFHSPHLCVIRLMTVNVL